MKRRQFFKATSSAMLGTWLFGDSLFAKESLASTWSSARAQVLSPQAKSVILLYLDGGPSQTDTFDPKPQAGKDYFGPYKKVLQTPVEGLLLGEKLPLLAQISDKYAVVRSMLHHIPAHETAHYAMMTGDLTRSGQIVYPAFGAVIAKMLENKQPAELPAYISVTSASSRFNEAGFLGAKYKSFDTGGAPEAPVFNVEGIVNHDVSDEELLRKKQLLSKLESTTTKPGLSKQLNSLREANYSLILGDSRKVFDLNEEPESVRDRYGRHRFGQSCLLARRLVQQGVLFVNVRFSGWDTHKEHFKKMDERLGMLDQGVSALLEDLAGSGLLDQTIVLCGGEFGRTPKIMWEPPWNGGRGHFGEAFSYLVAGGGFIGGRVVGKTDSKGEKVIERPVYPHDLIGSVYRQLGIDPYGSVNHPQFGKVPLLPSLGKTSKKGKGLLDELIA